MKTLGKALNAKSSAITGLLMAFGALALFAAPVSASAETAAEKKCYNFIQGNIPWDKKNKKTAWNPSNVKKMCKGVKTGKHSQPGICYSKVQGNVAWDRKGKNKLWNWPNVVKLCAGTNNAQYRVNCFKSKVKRMGWSKAINQCIPKKRNMAAEKKCYNFVQGNIPWDTKNSNARWNPTNVKKLCKYSKPGKHAQPGLCYSRVQGNVAWNKQGNKKWNWKNVVNLCAGTSNASSRINCFKGKMKTKGWSKAIQQCKVRN